MRQTQLNVAGLVLIGSASLRRRHFKSRSLVNSNRAGAHCDLVTRAVSALFSADIKRRRRREAARKDKQIDKESQKEK